MIHEGLVVVEYLCIRGNCQVKWNRANDFPFSPEAKAEYGV